MNNTISTTFKLIDDFSPGLQKINDKMGGVSGALNKMKSALGGLSSKKIDEAAQSTSKLDSNTVKLVDSSKKQVKESEDQGDAIDSLLSKVDGLAKGFKTVVGAIGALGGATAIIGGLKKAFEWSDEVTNMNARLTLVNNSFNQLNGTSQSLEEFNKKIFEVAQDTGSSLDDMKNFIVSLGQNAASAFSNTDELTAFGDELNKAFQITGVSGVQANAAMLQLTQGLASGKLQGDEFESMMENAPGVMQIVANSLGVTTGQLRDMSTAGKITADTFVNALMGAKDTIDSTYNQMPVTFDMVFNRIRNTVTEATEPIATAINQVLNSAPVQQAMNDVIAIIEQNLPLITQLISGAITSLPGLIQNVTNALNWIVQNGDEVGQVIFGIIGAATGLKIFGGVTTLLSAFGVSLTAITGPVGLVIAGVSAIIGTLIYCYNTNEDFRNKINLIWSSICNFFTNAGNIISGIINWIGKQIHEFGDSIATLKTDFINNWNSLVNWFKGIPARIGEIATNIITGFKNGLVNGWKNITNWVKDKFSGIVDTAKNALQIHSPSKPFVEIGANLVNAIGVGTQQEWGGLQNSLASQFASLQDNVAVPELTPSISVSKNPIQAPQISDNSDSLDELSDNVSTAYTGIYETAQKNLTSLNDNTTSTFTQVSDNTNATHGNMLASLNNFGSAYISNNENIWTTVLNTTIEAVTNLYNQVTAIFNNLINAIKNGLGQLPSYFSNIAVQMMDGLINGMNSKRASVVGSTNELVKAVKDAFIKGLGVHSPSVFGDYIGRMLGLGIIQGLNKTQVDSFIAFIVQNMKNSFKNGKFVPDELVDYLGQDTTKVIDYLVRTGDNTLQDVAGSVSGTPAIITEALKYVGYAPGGGNSMFGLYYGNPGAWCASFVRYCAEKAGVAFPATNYVPDVLAWANATGRSTNIPQPGYAAIFGGGSHIELVAGVSPDGTVDMVGGNTGMGEVKHRPRSDATSYVALDGGHSMLTLKDAIQQAYNKKFGLAVGAATQNMYNPTGGVGQWSNVVLQALALLGQPASLLNDVLYAIQSESSGNPNAINLTDSNAAAGHPSQGLLQLIPSTFAEYRNPGLSGSITDPLANVYAGLHYMIGRYGSIENVINPRRGKWRGYAAGTNFASQGLAVVGENGPELINFRGGESVANANDTRAMLNYRALGNDLAIDSLLTGQAGNTINNYIDIENNINNQGDLNGAETLIYDTIVNAIKQEHHGSGSQRRL